MEPATTRPTTSRSRLRIEGYDLGLKPVGVEGDDAKISNALAATRDFVSKLESRHPKPFWVTLWGKSGSGKTTLAKRVWKYWLETAQWEVCGRTGANLCGRGSFWSWPHLMKEIHDDYSIMDDLTEEIFVVLDDIGSDRDKSGFNVDKLSYLLDQRLKKWTLITTNLPLKEIAAKLDPRIASRMIRGDNIVVDLDVMDFSLRDK